MNEIKLKTYPFCGDEAKIVNTKKTKKKPQKHGTGGQTMRLIDADELIERIGKWMPKDPCGREQTVEERIATDIAVSVCMQIKEAPTAFDKGKVLEELKKHADIAIETNEAYGSEVAFGEWSAYKQAEEIVKKGGIE